MPNIFISLYRMPIQDACIIVLEPYKWVLHKNIDPQHGTAGEKVPSFGQVLFIVMTML